MGWGIFVCFSKKPAAKASFAEYILDCLDYFAEQCFLSKFDSQLNNA